VQERVIFAGQLAWSEVRELLDSAKVLLFTSLRDSSGVQLLEAAARGVPIVALRLHGAGEWVPPSAGVLVDPSTPGEAVKHLAIAVRKLLDDDAAWEAASQEALLYSYGHSAEMHAELLGRVYEQALESP
jgi:glycosyltransferase involved in cell wall biosynthesis